METPDKLIVFVDYQNTYMAAREAFFDDAVDHHTCGQIHPLKLGELLAERSNQTRTDGRRTVLHQVRLYCGMPDSEKDPKGNSARLRQVQIWGRMPGVQVLHRPLRYPGGSLPPQEKGVDVQLAVDVIRMALQGEYQLGVIFSRDTDLRPVLETMLDLKSHINVTCTVAAWQPDTGRRHSLQVPNHRVWCYYLTRRDFNSVADKRDYRQESAGAVRPRWAR